jgi:DNA-binding NarL/FixJ family response regulator
VRLVICDHQRILAEALAAALSERGHQVLAVTTTAAEGVAAVGVGRPEVCVLDLQFDDEPSGLEAAHTITARHPDTKVLILSGVTDPKTLSLVRTNDAAGFIRKDQSVDQIAAALEVIAGGGNPRIRWKSCRRERKRLSLASSGDKVPGRCRSP